MFQDKVISKDAQSGQWSLMHVLMATVFFMPMVAAIGELRDSGGGTLRYLVAVPLALAVGALIVSLDGKLGKVLWSRSQQCSKRGQDVVALVLFALELLWIAVGFASGFKLAVFVAKHISG